MENFPAAQGDFLWKGWEMGAWDRHRSGSSLARGADGQWARAGALCPGTEQPCTASQLTQWAGKGNGSRHFNSTKLFGGFLLGRT